MKILIYATTFGADLLSLTYYLSTKTDCEIKVLMSGVDTFKQEGIFKIWNVNVDLVEMTKINAIWGIKGFDPDITIMDNKVPMKKLSPKALILWHGYGWKGPNDEEEFKWLHKNIKLSWGDMKIPNPDIKWQCFGPIDFKHRSEISGFHPENCVMLGSASHDYLRGKIDKEVLQPFYPFDVVNHQTVLIAPTWHYGEVFSHWGDDSTIFKNLISDLNAKDINVILRLHDSFRFDKTYVKFLKALENDNGNVLLKFKNHHPDNFLDLQVSDVMVTNFSSIANLFYATHRPTVHIYPVKSEDEAFMWRSKTIFGIRKTMIDNVKFIWKYSPEDNGGLLARDYQTLIQQIYQSLENHDICYKKSQAYLDKHMLGADGKNCERIWNEMQRLVN